MRLFAVALTLSLAAATAASAQTATPDSENGRYTFNPVADGVLRLDTRTGQVSQCSRSDAGWACKVVPDERLGAGDRDRPPAGRECDDEEGALLAWAAGARRFGSVRRKARRGRAQAAERCRDRQGGFVPREGLAPFDRDGSERAEGRREEKLKELERVLSSAVPASPR